MAFKDTLANLKSFLKEKLDDNNLELITKIDKELDSLSEEHNKTETSLAETKDKLIEVVKNTSFKGDSDVKPTPEADTDEPKDIDSILQEAIDEQIQNRPK